MVALKPGSVACLISRELAKQERRGGIETRLREEVRMASRPEAGTPWWH